MFNPEEFLDVQIDGATSTKSTPIPVGEALAVIESVKMRQWQKKDDPSKAGLCLDIFWSIEDQKIKDELGRDKVTCKQTIMLELTTDGRIAQGKGQNVPLGKLRDAVGLNQPNQVFSFNMLPGRMGKPVISHRVDGEEIFAEIKKVLPAQ